jgi:hypothetical protein
MQKLLLYIFEAGSWIVSGAVVPSPTEERR